MQVYKGLDIATNKVTEEECRGVPHHLLGIIDPYANFTSDDFRFHASRVVESIQERDRVPIIAGGSNSYIKALAKDDHEFRQKYECCFLCVDVSLPVLHSFLSERVDRMVKAGLIEEVRNMFDPHNSDYSQGIRRAIGVPELDQYLRSELSISVDANTRAKLLDAAIARIKENNCILACRQLQKIKRLQIVWNMHRIDATEVFLKRGEEAGHLWEKRVAEPSTMIAEQFLYHQDDHLANTMPPSTSPLAIFLPAIPAAWTR